MQLRAGDATLAIAVDAGARLASLVAGGRERIRGPGDSSRPEETSWGCFFMAPWAGRIGGGRIDWDGREVALPRNLGPHSIHGVVFDRRWEVRERTESSATLTCDLERDRWAWGGSAGQRVTLAPGRLELEGWVEAADDPMPAALGWHPWFLRPEAGDAEVVVSSASVLETTPDLVPTGAVAPVEGITDLRRRAPLGDRRLDHVYVDARSPAMVHWPDLVLTMSFEAPVHAIVVHTPPEGFCVEPQTAWPHAPALVRAGIGGTGLARLAPGERLDAHVTWAWEPAPATR
jgi:aldose 1-epimerase